MGSGIDKLTGLKDDAIDYARLRWASLRLDAVDKLSGGVSKVLGYLIAVFILLFALAFLMFALALWVGEMLESPALGFLIAGSGFLLIGILTFFIGRRLLVNPVVKFFANLFFTDKDDDYGRQE